jgi:hypothetical protein
VRIIAATVIRVLHPVGPLPASVYWRRRALAFAAVVAVLLVLWAVLPGGGDDRPRDSAAAAGSPSPTEPAAAATSVDPSGLTASAAPGDPGRAGDGPATTAAPPPTTPSPTPRPVPPKACADSALRLTVAPARPAYVVGQAPVLRLQVRNAGTLSCIRDLGAALQEVLLYRGSQRLWSSNDCYPEGERDVEVLGPGVVYTFSVTWSGLSSQPRCAGTRTRVGAGSYTLIGRLGTLISPRTPIVLRAA